jgi:hypothetical protein
MGTGLSIIFYSTIAGLSAILGIAFLHLFPESLELSEHAVLFIFAGFLLFYLLENVMVVHSGSEIHFTGKGNPQHTKGMVMLSGLFFTPFLHELPEGVTSFSLLIGSIKRKTALHVYI